MPLEGILIASSRPPPSRGQCRARFLSFPLNLRLKREVRFSNPVFVLTLVTYIALALILHEVGHLIAARKCNVTASELSLGLGPRLCGFSVSGVCFSLRVIPLGSFVRLDGDALKDRSTQQQLFVHLGGVLLNIVAGLATFGTIFSWINLLIAAGNLLPLYQHDGWKCGVVIVRSLMQRQSQSVEWAFTFSGGFVSLVAVWAVIRIFI